MYLSDRFALKSLSGRHHQSKSKMPVAENGQKAFPGSGTKKGLEIWRIEFFKAAKVAPKDHGKFYKGDSYIILETIDVGRRANLYFWLGPETSQDEQGAAAQLTVTLDDELGGFPVQHREVGGYEDAQFKNLFPRMSLLDGGHASAFKEGKKRFEKALIQVKGKRKVYGKQVPLTVDSLNNGDCFVFDCGRKLFVWLGKESNPKERFNAITYARELRDEERAGLATVIIVGTPEEEEDFFFNMTGNSRIVPITKEGTSDEAYDESLKLNLYRVKEDATGNITMKETGSKPLKREDLDSDDAFILETGVGVVYVWQGKKSSVNEKKESFRPCPKQLDQRPKFEVKSMHGRRTSVTSSLPDDGSGTMQVWRVKGFELEQVPAKSYGVFYSEQQEKHIIYFWLGNDSSQDEQAAASRAAVTIDDQFAGEPYQGGHASGFKNIKNEETSRETRLLQVRVTGNNSRIVEVFPAAQSLNSSDVFVLHSPHGCFIWVGKGSIGDERECAKEAVRRIRKSDSDDADLVMEGREPDKFWNMLGGKADYGSAKQSWAEEEAAGYEARLFHCSNASGRFLAEEIYNFNQVDLEEDDVMILDAWTQLFVWVGATARRDEKQEAITSAMVMLPFILIALS
ncbi:hypothetical protein OS493_008955 [Desmophyllum pertusum]|uniref:Gelsolin-like domain-containing protein n=1 Tax=Desmophyllum pertusum TaxID=174260 RepID=A0A9W9ZEY3_9CNID|nr:hypothetical protein OS493_008955 [Desmophyllum pertusum]